jgi:hypothetical protein
MANEPQTITSMDGQKITLSPFDIKAIRNIEKGVEIDTHAGDTFRIPISRYIFELMFTIDISGKGNSAKVVTPISTR